MQTYISSCHSYKVKIDQKRLKSKKKNYCRYGKLITYLYKYKMFKEYFSLRKIYLKIVKSFVIYLLSSATWGRSVGIKRPEIFHQQMKYFSYKGWPSLSSMEANMHIFEFCIKKLLKIKTSGKTFYSLSRKTLLDKIPFKDLPLCSSIHSRSNIQCFSFVFLVKYKTIAEKHLLFSFYQITNQIHRRSEEFNRVHQDHKNSWGRLHWNIELNTSVLKLGQSADKGDEGDGIIHSEVLRQP